MTTTSSMPALPSSTLAQEAVAFVKGCQPTYLFNHSIRSYLFAAVIARQMGLAPGDDYDDETLFYGCIMHDLGLTDEGNGDQRFEVDGADLAVKFLLERGLSEDRAEIIWDAIALHTSAGIAQRKRHEISVTSFGIAADVLGIGAEQIPEEVVEDVHRLYPRLNICYEAPRAIVAQVEANPQKAPLYSAPAGLAIDFHSAVVPPTWDQFQSVHPWRDRP